MKVFIMDKCCDISRNYIKGFKMANDIEFVYSVKDADIICYIGCAYTIERINSAIDSIYELIQEKDYNQSLAIFGCSTAYPDFYNLFKDNPHIDFIGKSTGSKMQFEIAEYLEKKWNTETHYPELGINFRYPHRLDIVVEDGCNKRCAFCKSNYLNLHLKSIPLDKLIRNIQFFAQEYGITEVNLTGLNVSSYGSDLNTTLLELIQKVSSINEIDTILLDSLCPDEISDELLKEIVNNPKIKRVMIPIQSMSNHLLEKMGRLNTADRAFKILNTISTLRPDIFIETIFLICYPTETVDDIKRNIELLERVRIHNPNLSVYCYGRNVPTLKSETNFSMTQKEHHQNGIYYQEHIIPIIEEQRKEFLSKPFVGRLYYQDNISSYFSTPYRFTTNEFTVECPTSIILKDGESALIQSKFLESEPKVVYRTYNKPAKGKIKRKI